ncbi:hypothetical protein IWGMT90018_56450 [Mycobacterium kiyosense]|nr:hypothetical protein IWGMT90018_56450 [Mycobacterium kiyosense]
MVLAAIRCDTQMRRCGAEGGVQVKIRRGLAAGAVVSTAVAFGMALDSDTPAYAIGPPPDGTYAFNQAGVSGATWTIGALCVQPSGTRNMNDYSDPIVIAMNCALNIVSTTPANNTRAEHLQNFSGRARMTSMLWTLQVSKAEGVVCPDGTFAPQQRDLRVQRRNPDRHPHHPARGRCAACSRT